MLVKSQHQRPERPEREHVCQRSLPSIWPPIAFITFTRFYSHCDYYMSYNVNHFEIALPTTIYQTDYEGLSTVIHQTVYREPFESLLFLHCSNSDELSSRVSLHKSDPRCQLSYRICMSRCSRWLSSILREYSLTWDLVFGLFCSIVSPF